MSANRAPHTVRAASALDFRVRRKRNGELVLESGDFDHSVLPPPGKLTGGVWDALAAAPLLAPLPIATQRSKAQRILLLGVGGGAVLHLWDRVLDAWRWTGIERDAKARRAFREEFGLPSAPGELIGADALDFVRRTRKQWDVVVDDLFDESFRPTFDQPEWLSLLVKRLAPNGLLITNLVWDDGRTSTNRAYRERVRATFPHHAEIRCDDSLNRVLVSSHAPLQVRGLGARFATKTALKAAWKGFRVRTLPALEAAH